MICGAYRTMQANIINTIVYQINFPL